MNLRKSLFHQPEFWFTVFSATLIVIAFPPYSLWGLIWICFVPFIKALDRIAIRKGVSLKQKIKLAAGFGVLLSFVMTLGGFFWVGYVLHQFGKLPWVVSILGLCLFGLICQPQFPIFSVVYVWVKNKYPKTSFIFFPVFYTLIDWITPKLFADSFGHSLYLSHSLRQLAEVGGVWILTFLVLVINYIHAELISIWAQKKEPSFHPYFKKSMPYLGLYMTLFIGAYFYGQNRYEEITRLTESPAKTVQMAAIQANIGDFDKVAAENGIRGAARKIMDKFFDLSKSALALTEKPQMIIWPETAYPSTFRTPQTSEELSRDLSIESFVKETQTPLLFGGYDRENRKDFNAFFFLSPESTPGFPSEGKLQTYRKSILLPFGEEIPFYDSIAFLREQFPQVGNFGKGKGAEVFQIAGVSFNPSICYEGLYSEYVLSAARKGAEVILNITNDSWFGPWGEPQLHLALSTFRSVETRLSFFRATNTGITALILPNGDITARTEIGKEAIFNQKVPVITPQQTPLKTYGNLFPAFLIVMTLGFVIHVSELNAFLRRLFSR